MLQDGRPSERSDQRSVSGRPHPQIHRMFGPAIMKMASRSVNPVDLPDWRYGRPCLLSIERTSNARAFARAACARMSAPAWTRSGAHQADRRFTRGLRRFTRGLPACAHARMPRTLGAQAWARAACARARRRGRARARSKLTRGARGASKRATNRALGAQKRICSARGWSRRGGGCHTTSRSTGCVDVNFILGLRGCALVVRANCLPIVQVPVGPQAVGARGRPSKAVGGGSGDRSTKRSATTRSASLDPLLVARPSGQLTVGDMVGQPTPPGRRSAKLTGTQCNR